MGFGFILLILSILTFLFIRCAYLFMVEMCLKICPEKFGIDPRPSPALRPTSIHTQNITQTGFFIK